MLYQFNADWRPIKITKIVQLDATGEDMVCDGNGEWWYSRPMCSPQKCNGPYEFDLKFDFEKPKNQDKQWSPDPSRGRREFRPGRR